MVCLPVWTVKDSAHARSGGLTVSVIVDDVTVISLFEYFYSY